MMPPGGVFVSGIDAHECERMRVQHRPVARDVDQHHLVVGEMRVKVRFW